MSADGLVAGADGHLRCWWGARTDDYAAYHDHEWGRPVTDDHRLFEKLCLEGFQSGLSWLTILRKREAFRAAFAGFDPVKVAGFAEADVLRLLGDAGIVRHRGKIEAAIHNARATLTLVEKHGSLAAFVWAHEPTDRPSRLLLDRATLATMATTPASVRLSKALKGAGYRFVGPTTAYAFMQAMGLVNDHVDGCWVAEEVIAERAAFVRPSA